MDKKSINRIPIIDIVKGICIIMVIIEHYAWKEAERLMAAFPFWISMAVPVFMLVSGYVYTLSLEKKQIHTLEDGYRFTFVCKKIIRYTIPLVMAFFLLIIVYAVIGSAYSVPGAISELYDFMVGAKGAGGVLLSHHAAICFCFSINLFSN